MRCEIPGTPRLIVENLIEQQGYSIKEIAIMLGITTKTVYRIRKGYTTHPKIHLNLIQVFINLFHEKRQQPINKELMELN